MFKHCSCAVKHCSCAVKHCSCAVLLSMVLLVQGCTTTGQVVSDVDTPNEALLQAAGNHAGLIELYKKRLIDAGSKQESDVYRYQLGQAYLAVSDPESTLFYVQPVTDEGRGNETFWLLQSRAYMALNDQEKALETAETALTIQKESPFVHNQLGQVYARTGEYAQARLAFTRARMLMLDDVVVKNNLALMDILEGDYDSAVMRLLPLYNAGQADDTVRANLLLALVRSGRFEEFNAVLNAADTKEERMVLYSILAAMEPILPAEE